LVYLKFKVGSGMYANDISYTFSTLSEENSGISNHLKTCVHMCEWT